MPYRMISDAAADRLLRRHSRVAPATTSQMAAMYAKILAPGMWSPQA
jgi:hypothetical protein